MRGWTVAMALALLAPGAGALGPGAEDRGADVRAVQRVLDAFGAFAAARDAAFAAGAPAPEGLLALLHARDALLAAGQMLAAQARGGPLAVDPVDVPGLLRIEPGVGATRYERDYALIIDAGGDDVYLNNAGGAGPHHPCGSPAAAALIDLGGHDAYGIPGIYPVRICGFNGGGAFGGAGFLYDAGGDDTYTGSAMASNGGAFFGVGTLVDAAGDDVYVAGVAHNHLGTNGEGSPGVALLLDLGGRDAYDDFSPGSGVDRSLVPKGTGAQVDVGGDMHGPVVAVALDGGASSPGYCPYACVAGTAVSAGGNSNAGGCWGLLVYVCGGLAASGTGSATCAEGFLCLAATGIGPAAGTAAASAAGPASGRDLALGLAGSAACTGGVPSCAAASGLGDARGGVAGASVARDASGHLAVSGTGDSQGIVAVSGTGHAQGVVAVSGCDGAGLCA